MAHKPSKLDDVDLKKVEEMAGRGLTHQQIADYFGVSLSSITRQKKRSEEFDLAIKRGKSRGTDHVAGVLRQLVDQGNPAATIFYLKAQAGWRDNVQINIGNTHGEPLKLQHDNSGSLPDDIASILEKIGYGPSRNKQVEGVSQE